jgi:hypothetical protein
MDSMMAHPKKKIGSNAHRTGFVSHSARLRFEAGLLTIAFMTLPAHSAQQVPEATLPAAAPAAVPAAPASTISPAVATPPAQPAESGVATPSATTAAATGSPTAPPEQPNPFSNVKPSEDSQILKQEIPSMEQRLREVESRVSAIQQVQVAVDPSALNAGPSGHPLGAGASGSGVLSEQEVEMQTATFIACVNGKAMFRDSDQKPFFVDAKQASENDAVRRIGGCKH